MRRLRCKDVTHGGAQLALDFGSFAEEDKAPAPLSLLGQLCMVAGAAAKDKKVDRRIGPRPEDRHYRKGSASARVDAVLLELYPRLVRHDELMRKTGLGRGAISWAVRYLHERGRLLRFTDPRHSKYLRYKFNPKALPKEKDDGKRSPDND